MASVTMSGTESLNNQVIENKFVDMDRAQSLLRGFSSLYEQKQFNDVVLCVDDQEFPSHKNVLAVSSPFFMAMFTHDLAESHRRRIQIKEMGAYTMQLILDYIYTGEVLLSEESVQSLLSAANLFQMIPLRDGCADFMMQHVTMSNCIGIYFFAKAHHCEALANKANEIIHRNFAMIYREQEFLDLPADQLVEILRDDRINVSEEETVYEACLSWLNYSLEGRKPYLVDIMKCVRFANISSYYFCDHIDTNAVLYEDASLRTILNEVKYYHMLKNRQNEVDLNTVPRKGMNYVQGILIMANPYHEDSNKKFNTMEVLLPKAGSVHHLCKLPQSLYMPGACITGDNQIYLAGGAIRKINYRGPFSTEGVSPNLFMYDKHFGSWQVKAKMQCGRSQFCMAVVDSSIFVVGGQNETDTLDTVEMYDAVTNSWSFRCSLPQPLRCMTAVNFRGKLYVFGGETDHEITNVAYRYDPVEDTWLELPPMHVPRALAGSVVYKDKIYVIGGCCTDAVMSGGNSSISTKWRKELLPEHCVSSVEIFDPADSTWEFGPELPNALCGAGVIKYGGTIMVIGGEDDKSWMAGLFMLKDEDGRQFWTEGQELPTVMSTFGCTVANLPKDLFREAI